MAIEVVNRQRLCAIDQQEVAQIAAATLAGSSRAGASLTIAFVRDRAIRQLNRTYRGKDHATDVLSFPASDAQDEPFINQSTASADYLGDIVIAIDTARRQADEAGHTLTREVSELGRELHSRLQSMAEHFARVGRGLATATDAYNQAVGSFESRVLVGVVTARARH